MSALLRYLKITDVKSYHEWAKSNHPDKRPDDPEATHRFQEVSAEFQRQYGAPPTATATSSPHSDVEKMSMAMFAAEPHKWCRARAPGRTGLCFRKPHKPGATTCFYHMPGTDHLKYVEGDPYEFFTRIFMINGERTAQMCTAKTKRGTYCRKRKVPGSDTCTTHGAP